MLILQQERECCGAREKLTAPPSSLWPRYASLYFCCAIEGQDNELITLELIHRYVELLDKYFGSVSQRELLLSFLVLIWPLAPTPLVIQGSCPTPS